MILTWHIWPFKHASWYPALISHLYPFSLSQKLGYFAMHGASITIQHKLSKSTAVLPQCISVKTSFWTSHNPSHKWRTFTHTDLKGTVTNCLFNSLLHLFLYLLYKLELLFLTQTHTCPHKYKNANTRKMQDKTQNQKATYKHDTKQRAESVQSGL